MFRMYLSLINIWMFFYVVWTVLFMLLCVLDFYKFFWIVDPLRGVHVVGIIFVIMFVFDNEGARVYFLYHSTNFCSCWMV